MNLVGTMYLGERKSSYMQYTLTRPYVFMWRKTGMLYPASRGFSLARLLAIMKSFASLVSHVVGFCGGANKPTTQLKDFANAKSYAREDPLLAG